MRKMSKKKAPKVALMCGHGKSMDGSWDCGTSYGGNTEAALMLPITKAAVKFLRDNGVDVISDADTKNNKNMIADVKWANKWGADIYVSIHCDWYKAPSGTMPLYVSAKGRKLATAMNKAVMKAMDMKTRGVCKRTDLYELNYTDMPACIFETGSIKLDIRKLKREPDKYGKAIAKGICAYLGVEIKADKKPTTTTKPSTDTKPTPILYRVRASWNDVDSQVGAYTDLENAKKVADEHGLNVYGANGKLVYQSKPKEKTQGEKILDACKAQAKCMKDAEYAWQSKPTIEKSKKKGTCVTFGSCVLQRLGILKSGQALWQNGRGYGDGKVTGATDDMNVMYQNNKKLKSLKKVIKAGDFILLDDNKSGEKGGGGHEFVATGEWKGSQPYIWDMCPQRTCEKTQEPRLYSGSRKVLAIVRIKPEAM